MGRGSSPFFGRQIRFMGPTQRMPVATRCLATMRLWSRHQSHREDWMANKIDLAGRFAVVTGGAQGIGRAIAERFLDSGAGVAIWDRDLALAEKTMGELKSRGRVAAAGVDVTKLSEVEGACRLTLTHFGRIDILVNN